MTLGIGLDGIAIPSDAEFELRHAWPPCRRRRGGRPRLRPSSGPTGPLVRVDYEAEVPRQSLRPEPVWREITERPFHSRTQASTWSLGIGGDWW